jgi:hypothetical protein
VLRVAELGQEHGRGELGETVAEAEEDAAAHEGAEVLAAALQGGADDHDGAAEGNGELASEVVCENGTAGVLVGKDMVFCSSRHVHYRDGHQAADLIEGTEKTEHRPLRVAKVLLPGLEVLDRVEEHS